LGLSTLKTLWGIFLYRPISFKPPGRPSSTFDFLEEDSFAAATQSYGNDQALNVLINCGGIEMCPEKWVDATAESLFTSNVLCLWYFLPSAQVLIISIRLA
jgi:hypothetical protein